MASVAEQSRRLLRESPRALVVALQQRDVAEVADRAGSVVAPGSRDGHGFLEQRDRTIEVLFRHLRLSELVKRSGDAENVSPLP